MQNIDFTWLIIFSFLNCKQIFLFMCLIYLKSNKAVENSGYTSVGFTINGPWKVLPHNFWYFCFSNTNVSLAKNFVKILAFFEMIYEVFNLLLHQQFLGFGYPWQQNDTPLNVLFSYYFVSSFLNMSYCKIENLNLNKIVAYENVYLWTCEFINFGIFIFKL